VIIWRPFMRQMMREIGETRLILGTSIRQWMTATAERICAKFTRKTCLVLRWNNFECQSQRSKVEVTGDKKTRCALTTSLGRERPRCITSRAADATIRSLQRGVFARMRALGLAGYRCALPRISSYRQHCAQRNAPVFNLLRGRL